MRVLVIGINYRPELAGIGPYTAGLAEHLAARGDQVTVITGLPHYPDWQLTPRTPRRLVGEESIGGVRVIRAAHYVPSSQDAGRRATYEATFGLSGLLASRGIERPNAILGVVPSLSGGLLARVLSHRHRAPYGVLFQDLMGPAASQSGIAGGRAVANATIRAEAWAGAVARSIGVVSRWFVPYLRSIGVDPARIRHVPNWSRLVAPEMTVQETRSYFGWTENTQVVLHAGNMGLKQGLDQVVRAAQVSADRGDPVQYVLSGGGNQAAAIRDAAGCLPNVSFLGVQADGIHASLLAAADVLLLSELPAQVTMSLPSKLTAYFAAGRPIVAAVPTEGPSTDEIVRSGAGLQVAAGDIDGIVAALARLRADPALAARLADAGHVYAARHTSATDSLARGAALVDAIAGLDPAAVAGMPA